MLQVGVVWNPMQARLKEMIGKKDRFQEAIELLYQMHSLVHSREVYGGNMPTYMDEIWDGLDDKAFRSMPTVKDDTVAWDIWHITRIEDLTANYLIAGREQVLDAAWQERLQTQVCDTGNAMSDEEIIAFSNEVDQSGLREYRNAVGRRTREIIGTLKAEDRKRKVTKAGLEKIAEAGGVSTHPNAVWLLDFWGRKTVAGIIQMPITRHQIVHLNDCSRLRGVIERGYKGK